LSEGCKNQILVFDVGGSHISGGVFRPDSMRVDRMHTLPVRETGSVDQFLLAFESLGKIMLPSHDAHAGVAVAIPNPFDYQGGISYMQHKYQQLYGKNLRDGLAERLECTPARVHFLNDAAAFLMGEIYQGAAIGVSRAVGITLGTGVGSAFAVDGKIVVAGPGVPAGNEIWDLPYRDGSVEDFISTRSIQRRYEQLTGMQVEVREIADLGTGHPSARRAFEDFGQELGRVLREVCLDFTPQRIVLGGGISRAAQLFMPSAEKEMDSPAIQLRVSKLFERAPLIGAGVSWSENNGNGQSHAPDVRR
jgi:glucokinase